MVTKLTLEYDGTDFIGWARQPGLRTVQEEVERALRTVLGETSTTGEPLTLTVAGRTDRGVHAWEQVASYAHEAVDPRTAELAAARGRLDPRRRAGPGRVGRASRGHQQDLLLSPAHAAIAQRAGAPLCAVVAASTRPRRAG